MKHIRSVRRIAWTVLFASFTVSAVIAPASADAQPQATIPGDGVYVVGVDIQPGTYVSSNPGYCSWYRLSGLSGDVHDIIASDNTASGKMYVTIASTDNAFKTLSCSTWQLVSAPSAAAPQAASPAPTPASSSNGPNFLTQSQRVLCAVTPDSTLALVGPDSVLPKAPPTPYDAVVCQGQFTQPGAGFNAVTTGNGSFYWADANLAVADPTTNMIYGQTYHRGNWSIHHDASGTRFTNDPTGHGMFVSIDNVSAF